MSGDKTALVVESRDALLNAMVAHQRIPLYNGRLGSNRCSGCDHLKGETDGPNSPRHVAHQIDMAIASGVVVTAEAHREAVATAIERKCQHAIPGGLCLGCRRCAQIARSRTPEGPAA